MTNSVPEESPSLRDQSISEAGSLNPYESPRMANDEHHAGNAIAGRRSILWILFSLRGRIPRRVFWGAAVVTIPIQYVFDEYRFVLAAVLGIRFEIVSLLSSAIYLLTIWVLVAITVKRWHDRDKTGWWVLIFLIPIIGPIWQLVQTGFLRGTIGSNRYGPDPT